MPAMRATSRRRCWSRRRRPISRLFNNTTGAPNAGQANDPVLPERSHYFDAGVDQKIPFECRLRRQRTAPRSISASTPITRSPTDLIDNGQFGQALVLSAFNYAKGYIEGIEFHAKYNSGNFQAYANLAVAQQRATDVVSNQYLFDNTTPLADLGGLTEFQYIASHWIYTDHNQFVTASAGAAYQFCGRPSGLRRKVGCGTSWCGTKLSADMIYGSGLRSGDANTGTVPPYTQVNIGITHEFAAAERSQAADGALRRRQPVRHHLRDQRRLRHRRVRVAIRPAPRLLFRRLEEDLRREHKQSSRVNIA